MRMMRGVVNASDIRRVTGCKIATADSQQVVCLLAVGPLFLVCLSSAIFSHVCFDTPIPHGPDWCVARELFFLFPSDLTQDSLAGTKNERAMQKFIQSHEEILPLHIR